MSRENWKLEKDLCRCCLSEGSFKNLAEPCFNQGEEEVYCEMLLESLDINLVPVSGPLCSSTYTICEECILRLREACSFRRQVLLSEKRFRDLYKRDIIELHLKEEAPDSDNEGLVKFEVPKNEDDDFQMNYDDDDDNKSTIEIEVPQAKKPKPKKPKAKEKPKQPKKRTGRPRKVETKTEAEAKAEAEAKVEAEAGAEAETVKHKGNPGVDEYITVKNDDKRYTCKVCDVSYRRISELRYHINRLHLKQKFIKCKYCPESFMYHSQRKQHVVTNHFKAKPDKYTCDVCSREFKRKNTLAEHMIDVHIEKKCRHCDEKFARKKYLFHLNEKHGVAMPTCGICGLRTIMQSALVRHQRIVHLNEKTKSCGVCKKMFYTQSNLQDHMISHEQKRVFRCDQCAKTFTRKQCLKAHVIIHTGERPFVCKVCSAAFVQRAGLRFHVRSHHSSTF